MPENPLNTIMKLDPTLMNIMKSTDSAIYVDGALPKKIKLLMAMMFGSKDRQQRPT